jgi:hypothetical protein
MDRTETDPRRTSGLCAEGGTGFPKDAQVSALIWSRSGMPSGAKAWHLKLRPAPRRDGPTVAG